MLGNQVWHYIEGAGRITSSDAPLIKPRQTKQKDKSEGYELWQLTERHQEPSSPAAPPWLPAGVTYMLLVVSLPT
jgi:hypothetical protein